MPTAGSSGACRWDIVAVVMRGFAIPRCGSPIDSLRSFCMALQLGLFSGVFETVEMMGDADEYARDGIRTTSVVLGKLVLARVLIVGSSLYTMLLLQPIAAALTLVALVLPFTRDRLEQSWTRIKPVYGVVRLIRVRFTCTGRAQA